MDPNAQLTPQLAGLLALGAQASELPEVEVRALGEVALGFPLPVAKHGGRSGLNNDGSPLQLCYSASGSDCSGRLVTDPAWCLAQPEERLAASRQALAAMAERSGAQALAPLGEHLLASTIPQCPEALRKFSHGFLWLATGLGRPGLATYVDLRPQGVKSWDLARRWLDKVLPDREPARQLLASLAGIAHLASLGLEGVAPDAGRAKVYWRLKSPTAISKLGIELLEDPGLALFLDRVVGAREMPPSGLVMSAGFDLATGALVDVKVDLCAHCLPRSSQQWLDVCEDLGEQLALVPFPVLSSLAAQRAEVAFLGLGVDTAGRHRLNLYLKPNRHPIVEGDSRPPRQRIHNAVDYLFGLQRTDGSWGDYRLPVGESTEWVTGFVGYALALAARRDGFSRARRAAERAADWLTEMRAYPEGWGYNHRTGVDADSTAFALLLLRALGRKVHRGDELRLLRLWQPEGGFATYDRPDSWGTVHSCVTAAASLALPESARGDLRPSLEDHLQRAVRSDGTWPSFWWRSDLYSTFHHLLLVRELGLTKEFPGPEADSEIPTPATAFDLAYATGIEHLHGRSQRHASLLLQRLLDCQRFDGGWNGGLNLRVTDPESGWKGVPLRGKLYCDHYGTISTASALRALLEVER